MIKHAGPRWRRCRASVGARRAASQRDWPRRVGGIAALLAAHLPAGAQDWTPPPAASVWSGPAGNPFLSAPEAMTNDWTVNLAGTAGATLTNNVFLAPPGQEKSDLVLTLTPSIEFNRSGDRAQVDVLYRPTLYGYLSNGNEDRIDNYLNAFASLEAVQDFFFVEGRAWMDQTFFSPFLPGTGSDTGVTNNRLQTTSLALSPYIRGKLGGNYEYLVRSDNYWVQTNQSALSSLFDSFNRVWLQSPVERRLGWSAEYNYRYSQYESQPSFYSQQARLIGYVRPQLDLELSARVGYETNDYSFSKYSGPIYGAGLRWTPSPRTSLSGFAEKRFFGTGYQAAFSHRTRMTVWLLDASRTTQTYANQALALPPGDTRQLVETAFQARILDPALREQAVNEFLARSGLPATLFGPVAYYTNQIFVGSNISASAGLFGVRDALTLNFFWHKNDPVAATGTPVPDVIALGNRYTDRGVALSASHNFSALLGLTATLSRTYTTSNAPVGAIGTLESTQNAFRVVATQQLSAATQVLGGFRWIRFDSNLPGNQYNEQALFAAITHRF